MDWAWNSNENGNILLNWPCQSSEQWPVSASVKGCDWYLDGPTAYWQPIFIRWSINLIVNRASSRFSASFHWPEREKVSSCSACPLPVRWNVRCGREMFTSWLNFIHFATISINLWLLITEVFPIDLITF